MDSSTDYFVDGPQEYYYIFMIFLRKYSSKNPKYATLA